MDRLVSVVRHRRTGSLVLHPFGTFVGYGAHVGINPYRELAASTDSLTLGSAVVELLELSRSTGVTIAEARQYLDREQDDDTRRIRETYGFTSPRATTGTLAKRFHQAEVSVPRGYKSWTITPFTYSTRRRAALGQVPASVRVRFTLGPAVLGLELIRALNAVGA